MTVTFVMSDNMGDQSFSTWIRAGSGATRGVQAFLPWQNLAKSFSLTHVSVVALG
jgi:hypothetical protein